MPFPPDFASRYRAAGYWEDRPLGTFYDEVFASHGDRIAIVNGEKKVTYSELKGHVDRLARHLLDLGVRPLDRFVVQLPNVPEFIYLYFALERVGAVPIMALASHRWTEVSAFIELSGARGYILPGGRGDFDELAGRLRAGYPGLDLVLSVGGELPGAVSVTDLLSRDAGRRPGRRGGGPRRALRLPALRRYHRGAQAHPADAQRLRLQHQGGRGRE
jgi:non-ribosomal peptide synthetase component E (peptide arylation enzyme)